MKDESEVSSYEKAIIETAGKVYIAKYQAALDGEFSTRKQIADHVDDSIAVAIRLVERVLGICRGETKD